MNLYGFVRNDGLNIWDVLGLRWELGSWERTQAVRGKAKSQLDVLAQEIIKQGKGAAVPSNCPSSPKPGDKVLVQFKQKNDVAYVSMYFTGFFLLGGVSIDLVGSGVYSYDCCAKKALDYSVNINASFSDNFDELINITEPGVGDAGITFSGSWVEPYNGSFSQPSHRKALLGAEKRAGVELKSLPLGRVYVQNYTNPRQCGRP